MRQASPVGSLRRLLQSLSTTEKWLLTSVLSVVAAGIVLSSLDPQGFGKAFTREDGVVENLTALALLCWDYLLDPLIMVYASKHLVYSFLAQTSDDSGPKQVEIDKNLAHLIAKPGL
jgi:hypothetical protein